jgi:hypothetical protein
MRVMVMVMDGRNLQTRLLCCCCDDEYCRRSSPLCTKQCDGLHAVRQKRTVDFPRRGRGVKGCTRLEGRGLVPYTDCCRRSQIESWTGKGA